MFACHVARSRCPRIGGKLLGACKSIPDRFLLTAVFSLSVSTSASALPPGILIEQAATGFLQPGFLQPVKVEFMPDGRMFIVERRGMIHVVQNGTALPTLFIDLRDEVNAGHDRGLLGFTVDPDFETNGYVYLLYTVDPIFGEPDEPPNVPTYCRLTRYTADPSQNRSVAELNSRHVLIGQIPSEGWITCSLSHSIGTVAFAQDGSLLVGAGDGGHFEFTDAGGQDPDCFKPPLFSEDQDIGTFRAQYLDSMSGKILRIDPATGLGLPDNPFYNGDPSAIRSKVWVLGLRNPYRFSVRPGSGPVGTLYIGDVGWYQWEEVNVSRYGGENFGWPCYEGFEAVPSYQSATPDHSSCGDLEKEEPAGPHVEPLLAWHHASINQSTPPGYAGRCAIGGVFYTAERYHESLHGAYFFADYRGISTTTGWIMAVQVDEEDEFEDLSHVAWVDLIVDLETHPHTGDVHFITIQDGMIWRLAPRMGDCNRDDVVDADDAGCFEACFSPVAGSVAADSACSILDFDGELNVGCADWLAFLDAAAPGTAAALLLEIPVFVEALLVGDAKDEWTACRADVNGDDKLDALDISAYVQTLQ